MFEGFLGESIIKRAIDKNKVEINIHNIRDYSMDKHNKVDDTPYGGGSGMVLMCQPIFDAVKELKENNTKIILMTPQGTKYNQSLAYDLSKEEHLVIICGHYEGFDERIRTIVDEEISIGDYVLTGGEIPSMVVTDSIVRLIDGVIDDESHQKDSFNDGLLDYPVYTKPQSYNGLDVPDVLISGDHKKIENWRQTERIIRTMERRPDLLKGKKIQGYFMVKDGKSKDVMLLEYDKINGLDILQRIMLKEKMLLVLLK
jgi:tRNA (guanine37-N1)-methyltransferase